MTDKNHLPDLILNWLFDLISFIFEHMLQNFTPECANWQNSRIGLVEQNL